MASCRAEGHGDIVHWKESLFDVDQALVETIKTDVFCAPVKILLFFPGRRTHAQAEELCAGHRGILATPSSEQENQQVLGMYRAKMKDCVMEGDDNTLGWIGVKTYDKIHFMNEFSRRVDLNYTNFHRYIFYTKMLILN